jgi:hypothetical protein
MRPPVPVEAPDHKSIDALGQLLREGLGAGEVARTLGDVGFDPRRLTWLQLAEASGGADPAVCAARSEAAWTAAATAGQEIALTIGADGDGVSGAAVGLPPEVRVQWLSDHAPDLLWVDGSPPGWQVVQRGGAPEAVLHPRPAPRPRASGDSGAAVAGLGRLLALPLADWCVVVRLTPVGRGDVVAAQRGLVAMEQQVGRRAGGSTSVAHNASVSIEDPQVRSILQMLEAWHELLRGCMSGGGWRCTVHAFAATPPALAVVTAAVQSLLGTGAAGAEERPVQDWNVQPAYPGAPGTGSEGWLASADLGALLVPPSESLGSLQVRRALPGGRRQQSMQRPIRLGEWLGTGLPAAVDVDDLSGHAFIAGITGSGKSTTTGQLLVQLWNRYRVPFLVIDPAKADYQTVAPHLDGGLRVISGEQLAMNVLEPWPGRPLRRHIAHVSSAFRGAFGMPVPVPYVAAMLFEQVAGDQGAGTATLHDAMARLDSLVGELGYRGEIEDNIRASLGLRLRLLLQPDRAERVAGVGAPTWLTERPTLVQLGDLGDEEERAFLASMLVLYVADAARQRGLSSSVEHVTVVEEAHRLVPEPRGSSAEEGDAGAVAARLMTQLLAEIRGYGESVVIVDQSPAAVAREVLRNTTMKLAHRVVDTEDQRSLGGALGLGEEELPMLGSLTPGRCLVSTRTLLRPQAVAVQRLPLADLADDSFVPLPPGDDARCHQPDGARHHHASEAHGRRAELLAGLWAADGGKADLYELVTPLVAEDPSVRASCLMSIGIRRAAASLRRVGQLPAADSAAYEAALWEAALGRSDVPQHPGVDLPGPYRSCAACTRPCAARATVTAGVLPRQPAVDDAVARARSTREGIDRALSAVVEAVDELSGPVSSSLAMTIGHCTAVHACVAAGLDHSLFQTLEQRGT